MKLDTFFAKFELFADTPDGVAKMRELVLRLAVRGKLVEQNPDDGDATSLLEAIALARKANGRRKITNSADAVELPEPERWHDVPASWRWVRLGVIGDIVGGGTPRSENPDYFAEEGIPWLTPADLNGFKDKRILRGRRYITQVGLENSSAQLLPEGSVLFSSRAPIGYVAIAGTELATNQGFKSCIPFIKETNEFLYYYLMSAAARIDGEASGTTFREVSGKIVSQIPVPLPPLAEQKRIVAKVDELMALCDRLEAQQQERDTRHAALARASLTRFADAPTPANLDLLFHKSYSIPPSDLRKLILSLAVQGKLVPSHLNDELAQEVPVGDVVRFLGGYAFESPWFQKTPGVRLVRNQNISHGILDWSDAEYLPEEIAMAYSRFKLHPGDLVLSLNRPFISTGLKLAWIRQEDCPCLLVQRVACLRPEPDRLLAEYLFMWCNAPHFYRDAHVVPSSGVPYIATHRVAKMTMCLPSLDDQRRIVAKVDELMALVDALEAQLATVRTAGATLLEAAIHELLNPTAEIFPLPSSERESLPDRAAIGCYAIQRLADQRTFGRTAEVKVLYLAEAHLGLDLGGRYLREAAGPLDQWIYKFEDDAARLHWFSVVEGQTKDGHKKVEYHAGPKLSAKAQEASTRLSAAQRSEFDRLLALLAQKPTVEVEIIATLFAAWNDFLIDGRQPSDDEIVREVRENWHPSKERFKAPELKTWLAWLRQHALVPQGRGAHTVGQQGRLELH